jgi:hypothetical protein
MPGTNSSDSKYSLNQNCVTRTIDPLVIIENSHSEMSIYFIIKKNGKGKLKNKNLLTSIFFSPWYFFARLPPVDFCSWSFSPAAVFWKILPLNTVSYFPAELLPQPDPLSLCWIFAAAALLPGYFSAQHLPLPHAGSSSSPSSSLSLSSAPLWLAKILAAGVYLLTASPLGLFKYPA